MEGAISTQLPTQKFHTLISAKKNLTLEIENATNSSSKLRNFTNSFLHFFQRRRCSATSAAASAAGRGTSRTASSTPAVTAAAGPTASGWRRAARERRASPSRGCTKRPRVSMEERKGGTSNRSPPSSPLFLTLDLTSPRNSRIAFKFWHSLSNGPDERGSVAGLTDH